MEWMQVKHFSILETKEDRLVVVVPSSPKESRSPFMIYDGRDHALLFYNRDVGFVLGHINKSVSKKLYASESVIICECNAEQGLEAENVYQIPIKKAKKLDIQLPKRGNL